jgi:hypothetical protein
MNLSKHISKNKLLPQAIFILTLAIYAGLSVILHFKGVGVPDEYWFENDTLSKIMPIIKRDGDLGSLFSIPAHLGYGSGFWWAYGMLITYMGWFARPYILMRLLSLSVVLVSFIFAFFGNRSKSWALVVGLLFFCTFPCAWWTGKMAGPDSMSAALAMMASVIAIHGMTYEKNNLKWMPVSAFIQGIAMGVKLTAAPVCMVLALPYFKKIKTPELSAIQKIILGVVLFCCLVLGFYLANSAYFLDSTPKAGLSIDSLTIDKFLFTWTNTSYTWDGLFSGGLFGWSMHVFVFLAFLFLLWICDWTLGLTTVGTILIGTVLVAGALTYYGWYWFPVAYALPVLLAPALDRAVGWRRNLIVALVPINLLLQSQNIVIEWSNRLNHSGIVKNTKLEEDCIRSFLESHLSLDFQSVRERGIKIVNYVEPEFVFTHPRASGVTHDFGAHGVLERLENGRIEDSSLFVMSRAYMRVAPKLEKNLAHGLEQLQQREPKAQVFWQDCTYTLVVFAQF